MLQLRKGVGRQGDLLGCEMAFAQQRGQRLNSLMTLRLVQGTIWKGLEWVPGISGSSCYESQKVYLLCLADNKAVERMNHQIRCGDQIL